MRRVWWVLCLVACGDGVQPFDGLLEPPPTGEGVQMSLQVPVLPGQEVTVCKNFAVPDGTFDIGRFEHAMSGPSHHLLVYALTTPAATSPTISSTTATRTPTTRSCARALSTARRAERAI